ncbi:tetratricopeptide repeat-containing sensor histidine kinase [Hyunsoonleella rubra]|uniref:Oxygen sensor histidine kinase NreB n=1 Tax=Hyunsoonleella rubra TaxID=1737062 RepID=A0ABW5TFE7_9FLAO
MKFKAYLSALKIAENTDDTITVLKSLEKLSQTYDYENKNPYNKHFLDILNKKARIYGKKSFEIKHKFLVGNYHLLNEDAQNSLLVYKEALNFNFDKGDSLLLPNIYNNIGVIFSEFLNKPDSALFYYRKQSQFLKNNGKLFVNYLNIGSAFQNLNENNQALKYYLKADSIKLQSEIVSKKSFVKENLSKINFKLKNYKKAYEYLLVYNALVDSLKTKEQKTSIVKIKEQYDNEKLRADNLEVESKRKQSQNWLIGAIAFILFGGITAFLLQKNTRKKQKLAEQEKVLESQKLATVLKEQELVSIDAMIEGQEKERQRIADDLHDDLGGLMATVKLHFNALKDKQSPELFDKTTTLLDDAYQKIRSIAHAKNSGVIAKQGLLIAVQNMADKISASNKITVDVVDHGLEQRLENSLELTIFRIIQELITNVIKHAEATESTIHLTNHDETLNIMVEDNGKGFNPSQVTTKNKGMGISSIDKRIEHLNGSMTIESDLGTGTTIIIDIPI